MAKEKKIAVKFVSKKSKKEKDKHFIYIRLGYDRTSTVLASGLHIEAESEEEAKQKIENLVNTPKSLSNIKVSPISSVDKKKVTKFLEALALNNLFVMQNQIKNIIRKEITIIGENNYSVSGFNKRWEFYNQSIYGFLQQTLSEKLLFNLEDILSFKKYNEFLTFIKSKDDEFNFLDFFDYLDFLDYNFGIKAHQYLDEPLFKIVYSIAAFFHFQSKRIKIVSKIPPAPNKNKEVEIDLIRQWFSKDNSNGQIFLNYDLRDNFKDYLNSFNTVEFNKHYEYKFNDKDIFPKEKYNIQEKGRTKIVILVIDLLIKEKVLAMR